MIFVKYQNSIVEMYLVISSIAVVHFYPGPLYTRTNNVVSHSLFHSDRFEVWVVRLRSP